jgi:hypothetical protein
MERKRMSLDMSADIFSLLEKAANDAGTTNGRYILFLLQQFLDLPDEVRHSLYEYCHTKAQETESIVQESSGYRKEEMKNTEVAYRNLAFFFQKDEIFEPANNMHSIQLKTGILFVPNDWLILRNSDPRECRYAGVVEVQNGNRYNIPHAVFFSDYKYGKDYSRGFKDRVLDLCRKEIPLFTQMEKDIVKPSYEHGTYGKILNAKEYLASPQIGMFNIPVEDDPVYFADPNYEPPYGAVIKLTNQ